MHAPDPPALAESASGGRKGTTLRARVATPSHAQRRAQWNGLGHDEIVRYSRHLLLGEVGIEGQRRLRASKVLIIGAGGLGSPTALYLAAAGVGEIGLVDFDRVDASNLQRQILYTTADVGERKVEAARDHLRALNPGVVVRIHETTLSRDNALEILRPYDVIVDGTDNFSTRYLVNDACVLLGKPNVYGSIYRFEGQATVFDARAGPCYRCLFPEPPPPGAVPSCGEAGVLGVLPGFVGMVQATEAVKQILKIGEPLVGRLLLYDALAMRVRELTVRKDPDCVICGPTATQHELIDYPAFCGVRPSDSGSVDRPEITPGELRTALRGSEPPLLVDVREPGEWDIVGLEGARRIPKDELAERLDEFVGASSLVLYCHSGRRGEEATDLLLRLGLRNVRNLKGGIDAWAKEIDPSLPRY